MTIDIQGPKLWPIWVHRAFWLSNAEDAHAEPVRAPLLCFKPSSPSMLLGVDEGSRTLHKKPCGRLWSQPSPDVSMLVTLLVNDALPPPCDQDEHEARDNLWRKPQYLNHSLASLECFHDWRQSGPESCIPLTSNPGSSYGAGSPPELDLQSHPFRIAWLPGSRIYAAAALNHVWINDGHADRVLACWHQEDPELRPRIRLKCLNLSSEQYKHGRRWMACKGLAWSPDRVQLAWVTKTRYVVVSFTSDFDEAKASNSPTLTPHMRHSQLLRSVRR